MPQNEYLHIGLIKKIMSKNCEFFSPTDANGERGNCDPSKGASNGVSVGVPRSKVEKHCGQPTFKHNECRTYCILRKLINIGILPEPDKK